MKFTVFRNTRYAILAMSVLSIGSIASAARVEYSAGHGDLGLKSENGKVEFEYHFAEGAVLGGVPLLPNVEVEYEPNEVFVRVGDNTLEFAPPGGVGFLGLNQDDPVWILPQGEEVDKPYFGIAADELEPIFDSAKLSLLSVDGPGQFALWQNIGLNSVDVSWASADGFGVNSGDDELDLIIGSHGHYNMGFTAEGVYDIELLATLQQTGGGIVTETASFRFLVGSSTVPEPSSLVSLAIVGTGIAITRRRRKT